LKQKYLQVKEGVMVFFKMMLYILFRVAEEIITIISQEHTTLKQDLNHGPPEYKRAVLTT
jgi:hypothetical protein